METISNPVILGGDSQVGILASHGSHAVGACDVDNLVDTLPETNCEFTTAKSMVGSDEFPFGFWPIFNIFCC